MKEKNKDKTKKPNKIIETIKKKWLIDETKTFILVALIIAIFIGITVLMQKLQLIPIDLTEDKLFTLTEESKEQIRNIDKNINIYFVGYQEDNSILDLARQYTKSNEKITIEPVTATDRPDLVEKYGIESGSEGIIVACGEKYKVLSSNDLYTYDYETYESVSVAEEKLTAAIRTVSTNKVPKIYFLSGYSQFSLQSGMQYLNIYMQNEIYEVGNLDILSEGNIPSDCDTLVITTPENDFDEIATNSIIEYINNGGNILWLNSAKTIEKDYTNVNKILDLYGIQPFEIGVIRETNSSKMVANSPDFIMPEIQYSDVTNKIYGSEGVIFINATKINVVDEDTLADLKVTKTDLISTSEGAYFRKDFSIMSDNPVEGEEESSYLIGAQFDKIISEANEETETKEIASKLIIYGENYFASDAQLTQSAQTPMVVYRKNKDLVLNSIAYLVDREEDITVRKSTGTIKYTASEQENKIILAIITIVPLLIILIGIIVWRLRRKK